MHEKHGFIPWKYKDLNKVLSKILIFVASL